MTNLGSAAHRRWNPPARSDATRGGSQGSPRTAREHDLPWRRVLVTLASFCAMSAIGGGIELCTVPAGSPYLPPLESLAHTPFRSFLAPGLILAIAVGGTSLSCAWLVLRRSALALDASILAGATLTVWILVEVAMLRSLHWLHILYGALGTSMLALGIVGAWHSRVPRHRWVICVTLGETLGFLAPSCAGIVTAANGATAATQTVWLVAAGTIEGLALGMGQACGFPFELQRRRYCLLTALGAGLVWLSVMSNMHLIAEASLPLAAQIAIGAALAVVGLGAIGSLQWLELRRRVTAGPFSWIGWTALAWVLALPLSFTASPFVDESTPFASQITLWGCAGMLMAYVMALVTWQGVRRLQVGSTARSLR